MNVPRETDRTAALLAFLDDDEGLAAFDMREVRALVIDALFPMQMDVEILAATMFAHRDARAALEHYIETYLENQE